MKRPFLIGIGGTHSSVGKTTLGVFILKYLTKNRPQNSEMGYKRPVFCDLSRGFLKRFGAIKYTKTAFYASIVDDEVMLKQENKDTSRLLSAGAEEVLWVQSPESELSEILSIALDRLSHLDGIIIEGNSAIEVLKPDVTIFIDDSESNNKKIKASAERVLKEADIIIKKLDRQYIIRINDFEHEKLVDLELNIGDLVEYIVMATQQKKIKELLEQKSKDGTITCSDARKIAEDLGVSYLEVGKMANKLKIKIKDCKLGCF